LITLNDARINTYYKRTHTHTR